MSETWYGAAGPEKKLTQGDIILACPIITWKSQAIAFESGKETEILKAATEAIQADVVVMTQACDLEHENVDNVILCPHISLTDYKALWEKEMSEHGQSATAKAWKSRCDDICNGFNWNLAMLDAGKCEDLELGQRIVDFHEVFTLPRTFLESLVVERKLKRMQLLAPYREHLSQAFARFFMRVGLPIGVTKTW